LQVAPGDTVKATFTITNTGARDGSEIAEVYAMLPDAAGEPFKRLAGFTKIKLGAKAKQTVSVDIDPKYLSIFDESKDGWTLVPGDYTILVGGSSQDLPLKAVVNLK
jgi:beta-glucosidase